MMRAASHADAYTPARHSIQRRRTTRRRRPRIGRALFVVGLELGIAAALVLLISSSASAPTDLARPEALMTDAVAANPAAYRGGNLQVHGRVAEWPKEIRRRDQGTFVIEGPHGGRLLVVPADHARLRAFTVGTSVKVSGSIVIPPDSKRLTRRRTSRTAIAKRVHAPAVVKATRVDFVA